MPGEPAHFLRIACTSADDDAGVFQRIEDVRAFAGRRALVTFHAKADAARTLDAYFAQSFGAGGSGTVLTEREPASLTTSWQRFASVLDIPSIAGKTVGDGSYLELRLVNPADETFTIDLACVSVESWPDGLAAPVIAPVFERRPLVLEEALCRRYYERITLKADSSYMSGHVFTSQDAIAPLHFFPKRASPTITVSAASDWEAFSGSDQIAGSVWQSIIPDTNAPFACADVRLRTVTTSLTVGRGAIIRPRVDGQTIEIDAEL